MEDDNGSLDGFEVQMLARAARMAVKRGEYRKAELACNEVLALDASNVEVLLTKADAIAGQSRPQDDRTNEVIECCSRAIDAAEPKERAAVTHAASQKVKLSLLFHVGFTCKQFVSMGGEANGNAVMSLPHFMTARATEWRDVTGEDILDAGTRSRVSRAMEDAACATWCQSILPSYEAVGARSREALDKFVNSGDLCIAIVESAIAFSPEDPSGNNGRYAHLIGIMSELMDAHTIKEGQGRRARTYSLSKKDKANRRKRLDAWRTEIAKLDAGHAQESSLDHSDLPHSATQAGRGSLAFYVVSFVALVTNAVLLLAVILHLTQWVTAMLQGDMLSALFGVAGVTGAFAFAVCLTDMLKRKPSKLTGCYLLMCALALIGLAVLGWQEVVFGLPFVLLGTIDILVSLYYLVRGSNT